MDSIPAIIGIGFGALAMLAAFALRRRIHVQFGILRSDPNKGDLVDVSTRTIPYRPGDSTFAFGLRFYAQSGRSFRASVVHIFPARPHIIGGDVEASGSLLPDGRYRVDGKELNYVGGGVRRLRLSVGDPTGDYEVKLYIDGILRKSIKYHVIAAAS